MVQSANGGSTNGYGMRSRPIERRTEFITGVSITLTTTYVTSGRCHRQYRSLQAIRALGENRFFVERYIPLGFLGCHSNTIILRVPQTVCSIFCPIEKFEVWRNVC